MLASRGARTSTRWHTADWLCLNPGLRITAASSPRGIASSASSSSVKLPETVAGLDEFEFELVDQQEEEEEDDDRVEENSENEFELDLVEVKPKSPSCSAMSRPRA